MSALPVGTRVAYRDEWPTVDRGEVVEPTDEEIALARQWEYPPTTDYLLVQWDDDGLRQFVHVTDLRSLS